jgi:hypothetical protein
MPGHEVNRKLGSDPSGSSGILTVVAVAHAAHRRLDTGFGQALGVFDRDVLGGFKRSSQHLDEGGCDEEIQAAFGSIWAGAIVVTRSTAGGRTR